MPEKRQPNSEQCVVCRRCEYATFALLINYVNDILAFTPGCASSLSRTALPHRALWHTSACPCALMSMYIPCYAKSNETGVEVSCESRDSRLRWSSCQSHVAAFVRRYRTLYVCSASSSMCACSIVHAALRSFRERSAKHQTMSLIVSLCATMGCCYIMS